ncbi:hypothetical protein C8J55DRAFT_43161 [Lentinula edodes]|uniref:Uncharacterized protein n=1 Tax=Lentinula lateritia TaxID=40482 RepID=A0A9W9DRP9_9AGAR|nr:hypothetical protein C8J55DRAFT_43161 [Lentinula edodes]
MRVISAVDALLCGVGPCVGCRYPLNAIRGTCPSTIWLFACNSIQTIQCLLLPLIFSFLDSSESFFSLYGC